MLYHLDLPLGHHDHPKDGQCTGDLSHPVHTHGRGDSVKVVSGCMMTPATRLE